MKAYLVLITWPDGSEGLIFPRPGNVQIAETLEQGELDFQKAVDDMVAYARSKSDRAAKAAGATIRLIEFERGPSLKEYCYARDAG